MDLPDIEIVAAKVHEAWMNSKKKRRITTRKSESGEELMVPYEKLSEEAKELDRASVQAVYAAIEEVTNETTHSSQDGLSAASG
jgi:hypothetical protein